MRVPGSREQLFLSSSTVILLQVSGLHDTWWLGIIPVCVRPLSHLLARCKAESCVGYTCNRAHVACCAADELLSGGCACCSSGSVAHQQQCPLSPLPVPGGHRRACTVVLPPIALSLLLAPAPPSSSSLLLSPETHLPTPLRRELPET